MRGGEASGAGGATVGPPPRPGPRGVSRDGLLLIVSGVGYLLLLTSFLLVTGLAGLLGYGALPDRLVDDRDLIALFGWVGLMISGVSVIIVPNHLGVPLRPAFLPKLHAGASHVGLLGFFATALAGAPAAWSTGFLLIVVASFLVFGLGTLATAAPFLRRRRDPGARLPVLAPGSRPPGPT